MTLNLRKKKQQIYKKLAAQDRKQLKAESSLRFLLKSLFFDTVPKQRAVHYQGCVLEGKNRFVNPKMILQSVNPHVF